MRRRLPILLLFAALVLALIMVLDFTKFARRVPQPVAEAERADRLLVEKSKRQLTLYRNGSILRQYEVSLGSSPVGDKEREGDGRTPEGHYSIDFKNAKSAFHLSLRISYPNVDDREDARRRHEPPGGDIMIHGLPNGLALLGPLNRLVDWTDGCIAVTNGEVKEIWAMTDVGTEIEIRE